MRGGDTLIRRVVTVPPHPDDAPSVHVVAIGPEVGHLAGGRSRVIAGGATATTTAEAKRRAIGECLERYAAAVLPFAELVHGRRDELAGDCVDVADLVGFADHQYEVPGFPFDPPGDDHRLAWTRADDVTGGADRRRCWVPAQLVYLEAVSSLDEPQLDLRLSVGLAAAPTVRGATAAGLCEVIERHVAGMSWHAQRPLERLAPGLVGGAAAAMARRWAERGVDALFLRLPCPWPIGVLAVALVDRTGRGPYATFGLAAGFDWSRLAVKALHEAAMVRQTCRRLLVEEPPPGRIEPAQVRRLRDHVLLYADPSSAAFLEPVLATAEPPAAARPDGRTPPDDGLTDLADVLRRMAADGLRVLRVVVTPDEVRAAGHEVVRVLVPGLRPMDVLHCAPHLRHAAELGPYPFAPHPFG